MRILDIDNTISDDGWRIPKIGWHIEDKFYRYHHYHSLAPFDQAGNHDLFKDGEPCACLTSRPVMYHYLTMEWLRRTGVNVAHLIMRNNVDYRPSLAVKRQQLHWLLTVYGVNITEITGAYDDHPEVVQMYREHGIRAECRPLHNVSAYHNPITQERT